MALGSNPFDQGSIFDAVQQAVQGVGGGAMAPVRRSAEGARLGAITRRLQFEREKQAAPPVGGSHDEHNHGGGFDAGNPGSYTPAMLALRDSIAKQFGVSNVGGYANRNIAGTNKKSDHAL